MLKNVLSKVALGFGAVAGGVALYSSVFVDHDMPIGPAIDAPRDEFYGKQSARLSYYSATTSSGRPLVLLHSINAAANAYEMRPIFAHYENIRPVYALDLPGFGFSDRSNRVYSRDLYIGAIKDFLQEIVGEPADVIALSLTSEFAAFAAIDAPELFHSLTAISPTGLSDRVIDNESSEQVLDVVSNPIWSQALFDLLVSKPSLRFFLSQSFYGEVDEGLVEYHYRSSHQPGARYAPLAFVSTGLFTPDVIENAYSKVDVPVLVLYDRDANVSFERLPEILDLNSDWRARRILNTCGLPHFERLDMTTSALDNFWEELG